MRAFAWTLFRFLAALCCCAAATAAESKLFSISGASVLLDDFSAELDVYFRSMRFNRAQQVWNVDVVLSNRTAETISGPFVLQISSAAQGTTSPADADGVQEGKPFFDLSGFVPAGLLAAGEISQPRTISLVLGTKAPFNPSTVRFARRPHSGLAFTRTLDAAGMPLPGVAVSEFGPSQTRTLKTDPRFGIVTLALESGLNTWRFEAPDFYPVWRRANVPSTGVLVVPNPRLTSRTSTNDGGVRVSSGSAVITPLTAQTLPFPLPLGWSPLQAFWIETSSAVTVTARPWDPIAANDIAAWVQLDTNQLQWRVVQIAAGSGTNLVTASLSARGALVLAVADAGVFVPAPVVGSPLLPSGQPARPNASFTASGSVTPNVSAASLIPESVTGTATVVFSNALPAASGQTFRTLVSESYDLRDTTHRVTPQYETFVTAYQRPGDQRTATLQSSFPMRPLLLFGADELSEARVKVEVQAESDFPGSVIDQNGGELNAGIIALVASQGTFNQPEAVYARPVPFEPLYPLPGLTNWVVAMFELGSPQTVTGKTFVVRGSMQETNSSFVLARLVATRGVYGYEPVQRFSSDSAGKLTSAEPTTGERLPGVNGSGVYLLVRQPEPQVLVSGITREAGGNVKGDLLVRMGPWATFSGADGKYQIVAPGGPVLFTVTDLKTGDTKEVPVTVPTGAGTFNLDLAIRSSGPVVVTTSPAANATGVPRVAPITVTFSQAIDPLTVDRNTIVIADSQGRSVSAAVSLNLRGTTATLLPMNPLAALTGYNIVLSSNIADRVGRKLQGNNQFAFKTESDSLNRTSGEFVTFEPTNGVARVSGSAGTVDGEATVIVVNETTGVTATVIARPDGSFDSFVDANPDDQLSAVLINSNGTRTTIPASKRILADGGVVVFGSGAVVRAKGELGDVEIKLDPGSVPGASVVRLDALSSTQMKDLVNNTSPKGGRIVGQGFVLSVTGDHLRSSPHVSVPVLESQLDLAPGEKPEDASFALAAITKLGGRISYCIVDRMHFEDGKLVTSSPPFPGPNFEGNGLKNLQDMLVERGITLNALANFLDTNTAVAEFQGELGQLSANVSTINEGVAHQLEINHPNAAAVLATTADFVQFVGNMLPQVRLSMDLFAISYAPIQMARSRKVTVTGTVTACTTDQNGNCPTNSFLRPVVGAVVTLHQLGAKLAFEPGRIPEGMIYTLTDHQGRYALITDNTAAPLNNSNVFGLLVSATHPRFFGQRPVQGVQLSAVQNTYRSDLFFGDVDFNQPTKIPPFIAVSQMPAFPATGEVARVTIRATQGAERPAIAPPVVVAVTPLVPGAPADLNDVTITGPVDSDNSAPRSASATFEVKSARPLNAVLGIQASTGASGVRQIGYEISFGAAPPAASGNIENPDPNDSQGPRVARSSPGNDETVGTSQSIFVEFNEPVRKEITSTVAAVQLDPPTGTPVLSLSDDQRTLEIKFPRLEPASPYTLTLQSVIADIAGNALDPNDPTAAILFHTAPQLSGNLSGIANGSGLVVRGKYAFALDRGAAPALISYDLTNPTQPVQLQKVSLGVPYRDLVLIPDYSFVLKPGAPVQTRTLLAMIGGEFTSFFDELGNESFGGQYLRIYDVSSPGNMVRIAARRISSSIGAATKIIWSPPLLAYLDSSADFQEIGVVNLQSFIIGSNLSAEEFAAIPEAPVEGDDKTGDGDFVDLGETLPLPGRIPGAFAGKTTSFSLDDTTQRIQDFSFDGQVGHLSVVLGAGRAVLVNGNLGPALGNSFRTIVAHGQPVRRQDRDLATFPITEGRPKRIFTFLGGSLPTTNGVVTGDFAFVSVVPEGSGTFNGLVILDITDPLNVKRIGSVPIDPAQGLVQSVRSAAGGLLALATSEQVFLLDPMRLLEPIGANGDHPAVLSRIKGVGSGSFSTAATDFGLYGSNSGTKNVLAQGAPIITFVASVDTNAVLTAATLDGSAEAGQRAFDKLRAVSSIVPGRFRGVTNNGQVIVESTLSPPQSQVHYYVLVFAPGGAGPQITLALESLNTSGHPLRNKGSGFPLVSALDSTTRHDLGADLRPTCDLTGGGLIGFRLSTNALSPLYNVYLSKPFALTYEGMSQPDLDHLRNELDREILWSGHFIRASLDPVMKNNPVLGKFASIANTDSGEIQAVAAAVAESLPADYIMGPNPPPVEGPAAVPGTYGSVSGHNGEFQADATDFVLPSRRMPIEFHRHIGGQDLFDGPFGRGWDFNYNERLTELSGGVFLPGMKIPLIIRGTGTNEIGKSKDILFYPGNGRTIYYQYGGDTVTNGYRNDALLDSLGFLGKAKAFYFPPEGYFDVLMRFADGRFVRVEPDGTQTWYSPRGRLEKIQGRYPKNSIVFDYNDFGELNRIRDLAVTADRYLEIGYWRKSQADVQSSRPDKLATNNASIGKICTLRDYTQRKVDFAYDDCGRLVQKFGIEVSQSGANPQQFVGRAITTYNYGDNFSAANDIRGVIDGTVSGEAVFQAQNVVDGNGVPVIESGHGAQGAYQIVPPTQNTAAALANGNAKTTVNKPDSTTFDMSFGPDGRLASLKSSGSSGTPATAKYEYTNGLISKVTYPMGNSTTYRYDTDPTVPIRSRPKVKGILRTADSARGGATIPEATFSYNDKYTFYEGAVSDFNGNQITYQATAAGLDVGTITYPGAGTVTLSFNENGQLLSTTHIDGTITSTGYRSDDGFSDSAKTGSLETTYQYKNDPGKRGMPSTIHPPEGADSTLIYNARDELISETRLGTAFSRKLSYDVNGRLIREETALDRSLTLVDRRVFLQNGFITNAIQEQVETEGSSQDLTTTYEPDQMFRVKKITYPGGQQTKTFDQFDHLGRPHLVTTGLDYTEQYEFDLNGNLTSIKRQGAEEKRTYDGYDRLIKVEIPNGQSPEKILNGYYGNGELASIAVVDSQNRTNFSQSVTIDSFGRPRFATTASDQGSATTETRYDGSGLKVTIINPVSETTTITYNSAGQRQTQNNSIRQVTFDHAGGINLREARSSESGANFRQNFPNFNLLNQSTGMEDAEGTVWQTLEPRVDGLITGRVNARGNRTDITRAKTGEVLKQKRQDGMEIQFAFAPHRRMASAKDSTSAGHSFAYDSAFRLKTITFRDGSSWDVTAFDLRNNSPTNVTLPGGGRLTMGTDEKGRMRSRDAQFEGDSRQETMEYDALDRVTHATFPKGERTIHYDALGPMRDENLTINSQNYTVGRDIRLDGKRTFLRYPAAGGNTQGLQITEGRDSAGRLTSVLPATGNPIVREMPYASAGEVAVHRLGPGGFVEAQTIYDKRKRIIARRYALPGSTSFLADVRYAYDLADNLVARQYLHRNGRADFFKYDNGERLARADYSARPVIGIAASRSLTGFFVPSEAGANWSPGFFARDYVYTPGNLDFLSSAVPVNPDGFALPIFTTNFTGFGSFLETQNTDGFSRTTDKLASMTRVRLAVRPRKGGAPVLVGATLRYNGLSELIAIQRDDGVNITYDYQDNGLCIYRRVDDQTLPGGVEETVFVYDGPLLLAEYDRTGGNNNLKARYYYAEGDVPVAADFADSTGLLQRFYLMQEVGGTVMGVIDEAGNVVERYFYDAWGQPEIQPRDTLAPAVDQIVSAPASLLIVFSERVAPPLVIPALPSPQGSPAFAHSFGLLNNPVSVKVNGQPLTGTLQYEESSPFGFGRTFRFTANFPANVTNVNLSVAAGMVLDEWNNPNAAQSLNFDSNGSPGVTNFTRTVRVPTDLQPLARSSVGNPFLFHGQYFEYDAGLIYMRARYYDPATGQFLQRDPVGYGDSVNLYAGFGHNPISFRDPAGTAKGKARVLQLIGEASGLLKDAENIGAEVRLGAKLAPELRAAANASLEVRMARAAARERHVAEAAIADLGPLKTGEKVARSDVSVAEMQREFDRIALAELDEYQLPQELHRQHQHLFDSIRNASSADELEAIAHRNNIRFMTEAQASAQFRGRLPVRPKDRPWALNKAGNDYKQTIFGPGRAVRAVEEEGFSIANEDVLNAARAGDPEALESLRRGISHSIGARMLIDVRGNYDAIRRLPVQGVLGGGGRVTYETHFLDALTFGDVVDWTK